MTSHQSWISKHVPKSVKQVQGQDLSVAQLRDFVTGFKKQKKKAILLYGPTGCGKTSSVYAVAAELALEIIEVNASDTRNAEEINSIVGSASKQLSLFSKGKIILLDEIDGLAGQQDRGGVGAIAKIIEETSFPVVMTAIDPFDSKFSPLRKNSEVVQYNALDYKSVMAVLKRICEAEHVEYSDQALQTLARKVDGDLRGAINDLQTLCASTKKLTEKEILDVSEREKKQPITNALLKVFKTTQQDVCLGAFDYIDEDMDECFLWVEENIPLEYTLAKDNAAAFDYLSRADVFRGRIRRWQHWRFMAYIYQYLTAGIAFAKDEKYKSFVKYQRTTRLLKIWQANMRNKNKKAISEKMATAMHTSKKRAMQNLPYIVAMMKMNKQYEKQFAEDFDLDSDAISWIKKQQI